MSVWLPGGSSPFSPVDLAYERSLLPSDLFNGENDEDFEPEKENRQKIRSLWENTPARPSPPTSAADPVSSLSDSFNSLYFPTPVVPVSDRKPSPSSSSYGKSSAPPPGFSYTAAARGNQDTLTQISTPPSRAPVPVRHSQSQQQQQQQQQKEITPFEIRQQELLHNLMMESMQKQKQNHQYQRLRQQNRQQFQSNQSAQQYKQSTSPLAVDCNNNNVIVHHNTTPIQAEVLKQHQIMNMNMMNINNMQQQQQQRSPIMVYNSGVAPSITIVRPPMAPIPYQIHQHQGFNGYGYNGQPQQPQTPQGPPQEFVCKYRRRRHHIPVPIPRCQ